MLDLEDIDGSDSFTCGESLTVTPAEGRDAMEVISEGCDSRGRLRLQAGGRVHDREANNVKVQVKVKVKVKAKVKEIRAKCLFVGLAGLGCDTRGGSNGSGGRRRGKPRTSERRLMKMLMHGKIVSET